MGESAERLVESVLREALPGGARLYPNVRFIAKTRERGPAHDGEADLVVVHPEYGLLVIEVKDGAPSRDAANRWFLGGRQLDRSPFQQAEDAKRDLRRTIEAQPGWPSGRELRAGHAVAFPHADLGTLPKGHVLLGPDAPREIILDAEALADGRSARQALERAWAYWVGDGARGDPLDDAQLALIDEVIAPAATLHRFLHRDVRDGEAQLLVASRQQLYVLNQNRTLRRAEVLGPAGSGKSLVAAEKARRLAIEGFRTLYVCFNQPLASQLGREFEAQGEPPDRRPHVTTFHRLCEQLGTRAGVLPPKPAAPIPATWWDETLPAGLTDAIDLLPDVRYHAVILDEGQDFQLDWLAQLGLLLFDEQDDVFWVFHDPGQALRRDDRVGELGLQRLELYEDYRSPGPVAELACGFYRGPDQPVAVRTDGHAPKVIEAAPGRPTVEAVRRALHDIIEIEGVRAWHVAVLSGRSARESDVWRQRRFGNVVLWNGAVDDAGISLGLPADEVPPEPADDGVVLFETIYRFKGLERPVVILCELDETKDRFDQLLYTALTRATTHVVLVVTPELSRRLATMRADVPVTARGGVA